MYNTSECITQLIIYLQSKLKLCKDKERFKNVIMEINNKFSISFGKVQLPIVHLYDFIMI